MHILPPVLKSQDSGKDYEFRKNILITSEVGEVCLDIRLELAK